MWQHMYNKVIGIVLPRQITYIPKLPQLTKFSESGRKVGQISVIQPVEGKCLEKYFYFYFKNINLTISPPNFNYYIYCLFPVL